MKAKRFMENAIHGWFLLMGLVTVGCVLLISVYLIISGIPAIREIGLVKFLFGPVWDSNAATPQFGILPFILTSIYGTAGAILLGVPVGFIPFDNNDSTFSSGICYETVNILLSAENFFEQRLLSAVCAQKSTPNPGGIPPPGRGACAFGFNQTKAAAYF